MCTSALKVIVVAAMALAFSRGTQSASALDDPVYTRPQRLVDIGGRRMNIRCLGEGSPVVVFDSGLSDSNIQWAYVLPAVAERTRACAYDRAGMGFSDPSDRPSSSANIVDDLQRVLAAAGVAPPYVLVGHSFGGLNVRLFASTHLAQIAGLVLVDAAMEDGTQWFAAAEGKADSRMAQRYERHQRCVAALEASHQAYAPGSDLRRICVDETSPYFGPRMNEAIARMQTGLVYQRAQLSEVENGLNGVSQAQMRAERRYLGDLPLVVLTRTLDPHTLPQQEREPRLLALWAMHEQLASYSARGEHRGVAGTGHYIQLDRPEVVIAAINDVVIAARAAAQPFPR